ncbi:MAG: hypothetical protein ACTJHU_05855 [Mycetocola sp.]
MRTAQGKRRGVLLTMCVIGALLTTACASTGSGDASSTPSSSGHSAEPAPSETPTATATPPAPTTDGIAFVHAWADAGFPDSSVEPSWYCQAWVDNAHRVLEYDYLKTEFYREGTSWSVDADSDPAAVGVTFTSDNDGSDVQMPFTITVADADGGDGSLCVSAVAEGAAAGAGDVSSSDFVAEWSAAGFPSVQDEPAWYCSTWAGGSAETIRDWMRTATQDNGWSAAIVEGVASAPQVAMDFDGGGDNGSFAMYLITTGQSDTSRPCIDGIEPRGV